MSTAKAEPSTPRRPARKQRWLWNTAGLVVAVTAIAAAVGFWVNSRQFAAMVRRQLTSKLEKATGGRVEIGSFEWRLFALEAEAAGIVIHGDEAAGEEPYARIDKLHARVSILGFWWSPDVHLRDLEIERPQFHLILYPDGQTNQPRPPTPASKSSGSGMDTLFKLQAGHVAVEQGMFHIDDRAADALDTKNRYQPLDLRGDDVSFAMEYMPANARGQEMYRIVAAIKNLNLTRGGTLKDFPDVYGSIQSSIDLTRDAATLRSLRVTARSKGAPDRTLDVTGALSHFNRPQWQAAVKGDLDLRLLRPLFDYADAPEGVAHLDLTGGGSGGEFHIDGAVHAENAAYIGTGVSERGINLHTRVHADSRELLITQIVARLRQGGEIDGEVRLQNWLPVSVGTAVMEAAGPPAGGARPKPHMDLRNRLDKALHPHAPPALPLPPATHSTLLKPPPSTILVNGNVKAELKGVSIDTVLQMVSPPAMQRLGIAGLLNGSAHAAWVRGEVGTLAVDGAFAVNASPSPASGEVPAQGQIEGTYTQRDGAVDLRRFEVNLPSSRLSAQGRLGAYPLTSPTALRVDLHSTNVADFDTVRRALGLSRDGKSGTAALPVGIHGQADFRGGWEGSLASPRLNGQLQATNVSLEVTPSSGSKAAQPQFIQWDTIEAEGSYDAERITIVHSQLRHGAAQIVMDGTITAAPQAIAEHQGTRSRAGSGGEPPEFDNRSIVHARMRATGVKPEDVLPAAGIDVPITGLVDAQITAEGPLHALGGSGTLTLNQGSIYGEPVSSVLVQGSLADNVVTIHKSSVSGPQGIASLHGTYNLHAQTFDFQGGTEEIDLAKVHALRNAIPDLTGHLSLQLTGTGTREEPHIQGQGRVEGLTLRGQSLGELTFKAHTEKNALVYDAGTRYDSAELSVKGKTELRDPFPTEGQVQFTRFDVGTLLKLEHIDAVSAQSALSGVAHLAGPLGRPAEMRGDLRMEQVALTVAGVQLQTEGGLHAALDNGRLTLDALHIKGEGTDMRAQGTVGFLEPRRIDFAANGSINLKVAQTLNANITAGGNSTFDIEAHGSLSDPDMRGRVQIQNGSFALEDLPNSLSQVNGTLEFNQKRLEVRSLTALTGGGQLQIGGYLAYQRGLYASLTLKGNSVRIRYPEGVSSMADADVQLTGNPSGLFLAGNILITRFSISSNLDVAGLAAQANAVSPVAPANAPSNRVRLDLRIRSSPQLNFQNAYAKLAGDVDLRVRGTLATPSLQGRISITEGDATIAGTRYELQRGDISFTNPVRIQPNIDLSATARVQDYDISLGLHGTPDKMTVTYRSDPPLPEADVVALLALGRTQSEQGGLYNEQQQRSAGTNSSADVLLGGALNATVSSRVQKLFGAGSVKVDPTYLGALGNTTTRITVEEQLGKNVTLTYATNVDTTAQQFLEAEIAINRHVSLQLTRDESGVFSMVVKAVRRYR
ncbi:MAG TPA: translocation/assembly module TamB domain-containing protein [Terracidiphilus sp.]